MGGGFAEVFETAFRALEWVAWGPGAVARGLRPPWVAALAYIRKVPSVEAGGGTADRSCLLLAGGSEHQVI